MIGLGAALALADGVPRGCLVSDRDHTRGGGAAVGRCAEGVDGRCESTRLQENDYYGRWTDDFIGGGVEGIGIEASMERRPGGQEARGHLGRVVVGIVAQVIAGQQNGRNG